MRKKKTASKRKEKFRNEFKSPSFEVSYIFNLKTKI